jgi:predicted metal-binding membrane protein
MESARVPRAAALADRRQLGLVLLLLVLAAVAWVVSDERMAGMHAGPGAHLGTIGFYVVTWVVMMAAMMFPSILPMVLTYRRIQIGKRERGQSAPFGATACFIAGYLVMWTLAGLAFYLVVDLARSASIESLAWNRAGPYVAGGVILAAGLYQLTPLKDACLRRCRGPFMFLISSWRNGRIGALRMGIEHGGWCVGCCWALMAALFALGVMSLAWMALVAALIAIEKMLPWKAVANRGIAVLLVALGLAVAFVPDHVPGLMPAEAAGAMDAMEDGGH